MYTEYKTSFTSSWSIPMYLSTIDHLAFILNYVIELSVLEHVFDLRTCKYGSLRPHSQRSPALKCCPHLAAASCLF